jgi:hypothetical protein
MVPQRLIRFFTAVLPAVMSFLAVPHSDFGQGATSC